MAFRRPLYGVFYFVACRKCKSQGYL